MSEVWLPVRGWDGIYSVSSIGRVMSHARTVVRRSRPMRIRTRFLKPSPDDHGYPMVVLRGGGVVQSRRVHLLVAEAFLGLPPKGHECAHQDGDPTNPVLSNLRWSTKLENMDDMIRHGTSLRGRRHPNVKLTEEQVLQICADERAVNVSAKAYGVSRQAVYDVRSGRRWGWLTGRKTATKHE